MAESMEIEEVSFLSGEGQGTKRSRYEPNNIDRCRRRIHTQKHFVIVVCLCIFAITMTIILTTLTRPSCTDYSQAQNSDANNSIVTTQGGIETNFPWKNLRLPVSIKPVNYDIFLHPNLTTLLYSGKVTITMKVMEDTDFLVLHHAKEIDVQTYHARLTSSESEVPIAETQYSQQQQQRYFRFSTTLKKGALVDIKLVFVSKLAEKMAGFYASHYRTAQGEKRVIATTHFEPSDARRAYPCFDEPAMKATFTLSIVRDREHISLFNMPRVRTDEYKGDPGLGKEVSPTGNDLVLDTYQQSVVMSTYLVAFVVCDFMHKTARTKRNVTVSIYTPPDMINQSTFALEAAVRILDDYERYFQIEYPLPKLDLIAIPDFDAGAMENWGLITYRMTSVLYDVTVSSTYERQLVAVTVAHELAHQWFGNLVTMNWWDDLWLNEGFATYMEYVGADIVDPQLRMHEQFLTESFLRAMRADASTQSHPIMASATNPEQIFSLFDAISYSKGSSILRMLADYIGTTTFHSGLFQYLTRHKMANARTSDLWTAFTEATENKIDVTSMMNTWTAQMGFPVVTVSLSEIQVLMSQKRFLLNEDANASDSSPYGYQWKIPITYVTDTVPNKKTEQLFTKSQRFTLPKPSQWIKVNVKSVGFYRVNYDEVNWRKLSHLLMTSHETLGAEDRAGLLDDSFALARAGLLSTKTALTLTRYLRHERNYVPWSAALTQLQYINDMLRNTPTESGFKKYVRSLIQPVIKELGWENDGPPLRKYLRTLLLSAGRDYEDDEIVQHCLDMFQQWMRNGTRLPTDIKALVYELGVAYGGWAEIEYCYQIMNNSQIPSEKSALLRALTATRNGDNIQRLLLMSLDKEKFDTQSAPVLVRRFGINHAAVFTTWRFVKQNWHTLLEKYGAASFSFRHLLSIPNVFKQQYDLREVERFYKEKNFAGASEVRQTLETIRTNIKWLETHGPEISEWLETNQT